jgi:diguanylate cyclase (GGDEF)-like protein
MKILIAEDQAPSALFLRRKLQGMGHEVIVASDGAEAWEIIQNDPALVLLSDWMMPRLDGLALCRKVREQRSARYTYIILLTSRDRREDRLEGLRAGADDFLTKPVDADELSVRLGVAERILAVHEAMAAQNARLMELATVDELTGVKNRRRFREDLELFFAVAARQAGPLSVVMLDVDIFKTYNDTFGHPAGDEVLRTLARVLLRGTRDQDVVARYGGEEFAVLLPLTAGADAEAIAERLRGAIEAQNWPLRGVTASFGVATTGPDTPDSGALIASADSALYLAKRSGRNRVCVHRPGDVSIMTQASIADNPAR